MCFGVTVKPAYEFVLPQEQVITSKLLSDLRKKAMEHPTGVYRYNFHESLEAAKQEMIICLTSRSICNIHKHLDKDEIIEILEGTVEISKYNDNLSIDETITLSLLGVSQIELKKNSIHSVKVIGDYAIIRELTTGPFIKENCLILGKC